MRRRWRPGGGATLFSLLTQAYGLGVGAGEGAAARGLGVSVFMLALLPHALPELCALFLPLAAWLAASRRQAIVTSPKARGEARAVSPGRRDPLCATASPRSG